MYTLKHKIISPKFYKLIPKTELKGDTGVDLKNLYDNVNMCLNALAKLREDLLHLYQKITIHIELQDNFVSDHANPHYTWNQQNFNLLGHYFWWNCRSMSPL